MSQHEYNHGYSIIKRKFLDYIGHSSQNITIPTGTGSHHTGVMNVRLAKEYIIDAMRNLSEEELKQVIGMETGSLRNTAWATKFISKNFLHRDEVVMMERFQLVSSEMQSIFINIARASIVGRYGGYGSFDRMRQDAAELLVQKSHTAPTARGLFSRMF